MIDSCCFYHFIWFSILPTPLHSDVKMCEVISWHLCIMLLDTVGASLKCHCLLNVLTVWSVLIRCVSSQPLCCNIAEIKICPECRWFCRQREYKLVLGRLPIKVSKVARSTYERNLHHEGLLKKVTFIKEELCRYYTSRGVLRLKK